MIAWYSRERSSLSLSMRSFRVIDLSRGAVAVAIVGPPDFSCKRDRRQMGSSVSQKWPPRWDLFLHYHDRMRSKLRSTSTLLLVLTSAVLLSAQTKITPPDNKYTPAQDVQMGREAVAEVEKQLPLMRDDEVTSYVE